MKLLSLFIFVAVFYEISGNRVCGRSLAQLLEVVCENGFNGLGISKTKKSIDKPMQHDLDVLNVFNEIEDETPFKSDSLLNEILFGERLNTLTKTRRQRHLTGVHDECCVKSCTLDELASYCLQPNNIE